MTDPAVPADNHFAERYEAARKGRETKGSTEWGQAVLRHRGVVAWMEACSIGGTMTSAIPEGAPGRDATVAALDAVSLVPSAIRTEFVRVLAGMVSGVCGR